MCKAIEEMREESFQREVETGIQTGTEQNRLESMIKLTDEQNSTG